MDKLFEAITKRIAHPHSAITEHDIRRAIFVFICIDDYLIDVFPNYCDPECVESEIDFGAYAAMKLDELESK